VFVDQSGRRSIVARMLGIGVGVVLVGYLVAFALSLLGVSWVPAVNLPVVGDALPAVNTGTPIGSPLTERPTPPLDRYDSDPSNDTAMVPSPAPSPTMPASVPSVAAVDDLVADRVTASDPAPSDGGRPLPAVTTTPNSTAGSATTPTLGAAAAPPGPPATNVTDGTVQPAPPTDPGPGASESAPAVTAPRSPPTSLPSHPATAAPDVSHAGGNAPGQPPGARGDTPSATAPGRP
jgi:hypothetical protein